MEEEIAFVEKLEKMCSRGIPLYINGRSATPDEVVRRCVKEESCYMADYVFGDTGELEAVCFDYIGKQG